MATMRRLTWVVLALSCGAGAVVAGCKGGTTSTVDSGAATGGANGTGGSATGTGGSANGTGGSANGTGGSATGGAGPGTGGSSGTGGTGSGGSTGLAGSAGGSGGATATGGASGSGGASSGGAGGTGGTAGRGGAGGGAAGSGGPSGGGAGGHATTACTGKTYKLCEDFESGTVGGLPTGWTAYNGYGTDAATGVGLAKDGPPHTGAMALKSDSMVTGEQRIQKSLAALGATATKHWGRIFYKVQSPAPKPASNNYFHTTFTALLGTVENRVVDSVEQSNGTHQWIYNVPDDSCCTGSDYNWTFDANWHCAEWYVDVSKTSYRFFTDSTEVTQLAFTNNANAKMSSYTALLVGSIFYQTPPSPFIVWFDDLAIDDAQIGCQ
jgi:hypothetical protein